MRICLYLTNTAPIFDPILPQPVSKVYKSTELEIRRVRSYDEYIAIAELQKEVWGQESIEIVPPSILMVNEKIGGVVAGAFTPDGEVVAFVYGLPGFRAGEEVHWSHMLAVKPAWRGQGLGGKLKRFQKEFVLSRGIKVVHWSYDPLESVNARLNILELGALPVEYVHDLYGKGEKSILHRGIGTDRFIVTWYMDARMKEDRMALFELCEDPLTAAAVVSDALVFEPAEETEKIVLIEIPEHIQQVRDSTSEIAANWRDATRKAFSHYLGRGYGVVSFIKKPVTARCYYVLAAPK